MTTTSTESTTAPSATATTSSESKPGEKMDVDDKPGEVVDNKQAEGEKWFYLDAQGEKQGPLTREACGKLNLPMTTLVWTNGMGNWASMASLWQAQDTWYYTDEKNKRQGPVGRFQLVNIVSDTGRDGSKVMVWRTLKKEWKTFEQWQAILREEDDNRAAEMKAAAKKAKEKAKRNEKEPPEWFKEMSKEDQGAIREEILKCPKDGDPTEVRADLVAKYGDSLNKEKAQEIWDHFKPPKKRELEGGEEDSPKRRRKNPEKYKKWKNVKNLRTIYVSGMPTDDSWTLESFVEFFQKVGVIAKNPDGKYKAKLYRDKKTNKLKGDGVITFFHEMTANMAIKLKHGALIGNDKRIEVSMAKYEMKGKAYRAPKKANQTLGERRVDHEKFLAGKQQRLPFLKICILKNMFSPEEAEKDPEGKPHFYDALRKEITTEISKYGEPKKVTVFEDSPVGAVAVNFRRFESAATLVEKMKGRVFGGKTVTCDYWDGETNYKVEDAPRATEDVPDEPDETPFGEVK